MSKGVIIQASSRSHGNTAKVVNYVQQLTTFDVIDLNQKEMHQFDYEFKHNDDFDAVFRNIVEMYDTIILATPIYWYTMSGILKTFLDRISDFLFTEKEVVRQLKGRTLATISCGSGDEIFEGFTMPFRETANYLNMVYKGHVHSWIEEDAIPNDVKGAIKNLVVNDEITNTQQLKTNNK